MNRIKFLSLVAVSIVIAVLLATALHSFTRVSDSALAEVASPGAGVGAGLSRPSTAGKNYLPIIFMNSATAGGAWLLAGNAGTNSLNDFLGTTDNMTLTVRVSNTVAYRIVPNGLNSPNIIGGYSGNLVWPDAFGATIGGGGGSMYNNGDSCGSCSNVVLKTYGTVGGGSGNTSIGAYATVGGGGNNTAGNFIATVAGGRNNTADGFGGVIGGGFGNTTSGGFAIIGGGNWNTASGVTSTIAGGQYNAVQAAGAMIGGGYSNTIPVSGSLAFIGGGAFNTAAGFLSTLGGGSYNTANGSWATVGGGFGNTTSGGFATIGGGAYNTAGGYISTIGGGEHNTASSSYANVGGGANNKANNQYAIIGGGEYNNASGDHSTIGGGYYNVVSGTYATVPGGFYNIAGGSYAFAAGRKAEALHDGSFVWGDSANAVVASTGNDQFVLRAGGGIRIAGAGISTTTPVFIWRATAESIGGFNNDSTFIDNALTNGDPTAILIITQNFSAGSPPLPNNHPIGVYYDSGFNKWAIFNEDATTMTVGLAFNVLVVKP